MRLPDTWGQDVMFAFSGLDGETDYMHPFIGTASTKEPDIVFHIADPKKGIWNWREPWELCFGLTGCKWTFTKRHCVASDAVDITFFAGRNGKAYLRVAYIFLDKHTIVGSVQGKGLHIKPPFIQCQGGRKRPGFKSPATDSADSVFVCLAIAKDTDGIRFSFAIDWESVSGAQAKAQVGLEADFKRLFKKKLEFFDREIPAAIPRGLERLYAKCLSVLKVNIESPQGTIPCRWTTPDRYPHRYMWLWDSAFHVLGLRLLVDLTCSAPRRGAFAAHRAALQQNIPPVTAPLRLLGSNLAEDNLRALTAFQREDGFIASMNALPSGPWSADRTQPPILAWATWKAYETSHNKKFLEEMYPGLCRYVQWDKANRDSDNDGLVEWEIDNCVRCKCGESGMDNSPRFDAGVRMNAIDFNCFLVREGEALARIARETGKGEETILWEQWREKLIIKINERLWCPREKTYYDRYVGSDLVRIKTEAMFLPLFAGVPDKVQAKALVERLTDPRQFWTPMPLPSVSVDENTFTDDMWRGPVWVNFNLLIIEGLLRYGFKSEAKEMAERTVKHVDYWYQKTGCIWEFYDPMGKIAPPDLHRKGGVGKKGGFGCGTIADYNWSAAVTSHLITMEF